MEMLNVILSILSSALSIVATFIAFSSKKKVAELRDRYEGNKFVANGDSNVQVLGTGNQVSTHDGR